MTHLPSKLCVQEDDGSSTAAKQDKQDDNETEKDKDHYNNHYYHHYHHDDSPSEHTARLGGRPTAAQAGEESQEGCYNNAEEEILVRSYTSLSLSLIS